MFQDALSHALNVAEGLAIAGLLWLLYLTAKHGWPWVKAKLKADVGAVEGAVKAEVTKLLGPELAAFEARLAALEAKVGPALAAPAAAAAPPAAPAA